MIAPEPRQEKGGRTERGRLAALLLIGPTGAGKTPLGEHLDRQGLWGRRCHHFDSGARLRAADEAGPGQGGLSEADVAAIQRSLRTGALLEEAEYPIARRVLAGFLAGRSARSGDWVVLNGLPRHVGQTGIIEPLLAVRLVVSLECEPEVVRARIRADAGGDRAGRTDDSLEGVTRKLGLFEERTRPLLDHYRAQGVRMVRAPVQATTTAEEVARMLSEEACACRA
jgi:adenylate kinase family enzyme